MTALSATSANRPQTPEDTVNTRTLKTIRLISGFIALIGAAASYRTQILDLLRWGVDHPSAIAIPATVDLLGIICALVLHTHGVDPAGRKVAGWVLALTCTVSMTANALGGDTWGSRIAHVWCVLAYLAAEAVCAKAKANVGTDPQLAAAQAELAATRERLDAAAADLADVRATLEQVRTDAARTLRSEKAKARKAIREATVAVQPPAPVSVTAAVPTQRLWVPSSPAELEAAYLPVAPVSPAG
jgi:hypothetical protein